MQAGTEHAGSQWWVAGDMPVRADSQVTFLVDGRHTMWTMCLHFLTARHSIHLANWGITPHMQMVRGSDHRAGPDGSPEQLTLIGELQAAGLSAEDIQFWCNQELTVQNVLGYMVHKGVMSRFCSGPVPKFSRIIVQKRHMSCSRRSVCIVFSTTVPTGHRIPPHRSTRRLRLSMDYTPLWGESTH